MTPIPDPQKNKPLLERLLAIKEAMEANDDNKPPETYYIPEPPRYDEIYMAGITWLDNLP